MSRTSEPLFLRLLAQSPLALGELDNLITTAPSRYKEHYIEKRNGRGQRLISQPTAELKFFQRLLVNRELADLPIHESAKAYRAGVSIRHHALPHANSRYLLKLDFTNFFPSLGANAIRRMLTLTGRYSEEEKTIICRLLCRRRSGESRLHLSIGAPSSPFISNALMFEFDRDLAGYCLAGNVVYTRYADDLALSASEPGKLNVVEAFVRTLLTRMRHLRLTLNEEKTVNVSRKYRRTLTGLTLANDGSVSIGRTRKRLIRSALHALSNGGDPEMSAAHVRGMLAFVYSIEPAWVMNICQRYGFASINDVERRMP